LWSKDIGAQDDELVFVINLHTFLKDMSFVPLVPAPLRRLWRLAASLAGGNAMEVASPSLEKGTLQKSLLQTSGLDELPQKHCAAQRASNVGMGKLVVIGVAVLLSAACYLSLAHGAQKTTDPHSPPPLYHIFASSPYDAGFQHGRVARARIHEWFAVPEMTSRFEWCSQAGSAMFAQLKEDNKNEFPAYVEEMQGIAAGAEVSLDQIWVANLISEIDALMKQGKQVPSALPWQEQHHEHCSDEYAVSSSGFEDGFAHGHNEDWSTAAAALIYFLAVSPSPGAEANVSHCGGLAYPGTLVGWAPTWNSHGTFSTQNSLVPTMNKPGGLGCVFIQRRAICETTSMNEALAGIKRPGWSTGASLNIVQLVEKRMANVETWMDTHSVLEVTPAMGNYSHFNEYKHLRTASGARIDDPTHFISDPRQGRSNELPPVGNAGDIRMRLGDPLIFRPGHTLITTILNGSTGMLDVWCCGVQASSSPPHYSWNLPSFFHAN
jgi:hypothetical protein